MVRSCTLLVCLVLPASFLPLAAQPASALVRALAPPARSVGLGGSRGPAAAEDAEWEMLSGPLDPPQTDDVRAIRDARRQRMVLLNGRDFREFWELGLSGSGPREWTRIALPGSGLPDARVAFAAVYDSLRDRVLIFGGTTNAGALNDVWALSLGDAPVWTPLATIGTPPAPRSGAAAILDPLRDRMVIFGGTVYLPDTGEHEFADMWSLALAGTPTWTPLAEHAPAPPKRAGASAVYDPWADRMVLFGGYGLAYDQNWGFEVPKMYDDTWVFALGDAPAWQALPVGPPPAPRENAAVVLDPVGRRLIMSGGDGFNVDHYFSDTWALELGLYSGGSVHPWQLLATTGANPAVSGPGAIYWPERGSVLQFGGENAGNESFELILATLAWEPVDANVEGAFPSRRASAVLHVDRATDRMFLLGGGAPTGCLQDLWSFALGDSLAWTPLASGGPAPTCGDASIIYDSARRRFLAFAGDRYTNTGGQMTDVWALSLDAPREWTRLGVTGPLPPGRTGFGLVYDPLRDRVLMFGGANFYAHVDSYGHDLDDLWALSLTSLQWTLLSPVNSPGARRGPWAGYDPARDRMLILGGESTPGFGDPRPRLDDWCLPLGSDSLRWEPFGADAPLWAPAAIDPLRDRLLMWDGSAQVWALPLALPTAWQPLTLAGEPPTPRSEFSLAFDLVGDQLLASGGYDGAMKGDLLALRFSHPVALEWLPPGGAAYQPPPASVVLNVAILADASFSPDSLLPESITLAGAHSVDAGSSPARARTDVRPESVQPRWEDVNGDGRPDLVLTFALDSLAVQAREPQLMLRGKTTHFEVHGWLRLPDRRSLAMPAPVASGFGASAVLRLAPHSPAYGPLAIDYSLASLDPAKLDVFDVFGRRVMQRDLPAKAGGAHTLALGERALRPGLYLLRLQQGAKAVVARAVVIR